MLNHMVGHVKSSRVPSFVTLFNPIARRVLKVGALLGPNALITVRGRKSGLPRTTPVALVDIDGKRWVIGTFGETNWVQNLRAAGQATLTMGSRREDVTSIELTLEERAAFFRDVVAPYTRRLRIGPLLLSVLGSRDILDDPAGDATSRPVFELRAAQAAATRGIGQPSPGTVSTRPGILKSSTTSTHSSPGTLIVTERESLGRLSR